MYGRGALKYSDVVPTRVGVNRPRRGRSCCRLLVVPTRVGVNSISALGIAPQGHVVPTRVGVNLSKLGIGPERGCVVPTRVGVNRPAPVVPRRIERTHRDLEVLMAAFSVWVKIWFAHNPRIHADDLDLVRREAESRFAEFVDQVARSLAKGNRFLGELERLQGGESTGAGAPKPRASI